MNNSTRLIQTNEEFKIFADPYRMSIIDMYLEKDIPMTVKMVADFLNEVPAKVHYHVQKLLKIGILGLDHIEVINGIHAKYYVLLANSFKIDIKNASSPRMKDLHIDAAMGVVIKNIDDFRSGVLARGEAVKTEAPNDLDEGFITRRTVYFNNEDLNEFRKMVIDYIADHLKVDETKNKYSVLAGVFKKED